MSDFTKSQKQLRDKIMAVIYDGLDEKFSGVELIDTPSNKHPIGKIVVKKGSVKIQIEATLLESKGD